VRINRVASLAQQAPVNRGQGHFHELALGIDPIGLERMVAVIGTAGMAVIEQRPHRCIDGDAVILQDVERVGT